MSRPAKTGSGFPLHLYIVDGRGQLVQADARATAPDTPDARQFPYGAVVLPTADWQGNAVMVVTQPGCSTRTDVLVVEAPASVAVICAHSEGRAEGRVEHEGRARVRITMEQHGGAGEGPSTSVAVVRFAAGMHAGQKLSHEIRTLLAGVRYTIRARDETGWFEHGDVAFPHAPFRHGFPDIATREQGERGIRGPSVPAVGLQMPIADDSFSPRRERVLEPGERVICEVHVGTFTEEGTFAAAARRLPYLRDKGFTTVLLMPVDVSSGPPGWTYDQTRTGAVDGQCYGGSSGLIHFVAHAHECGLEVIVDKQYNHRGPEQDSRGEIIPGMFARETMWGPGVSGAEAIHYPQILKLIGEEIAYWVSQFGIDGFRLDATNRIPWDLHTHIADFGRQTAQLLGKPLYLLSEYAECEEPEGKRLPQGTRTTDQTGRYVMRMLGLSAAGHVIDLPADGASLLRPMLKAARRGWWYPDIQAPQGGIRGSERATTLLWHHDWIGNRFGGERIHHLIALALFKTLAVWQALGQWTPLVFMGTERYAGTPWFYFTGHLDTDVRNHTSARYQSNGGKTVLSGGRFHEFALEAREAGLMEALAFTADGTIDGIDWSAFREQRDCRGRPYMDQARPQTFHASKIDWDERGIEQHATERLFEKVLNARRDDRVKEDEPRHTQYKAWEYNEHVFVLRRRSGGEEFTAFFNLGQEPVPIQISLEGMGNCGSGYIVGLSDTEPEPEWDSAGRYSLWLDTNAKRYGGTGIGVDRRFDISPDSSRTFRLAASTAVVYSRRKLPSSSDQR